MTKISKEGQKIAELSTVTFGNWQWEVFDLYLTAAEQESSLAWAT